MTENEKREKVIKGLEICSAGEWNSTGGRDHTDCPYYPAGYTGCTCKLLMRDALALLKAQEPQLVIRSRDYIEGTVLRCPKCKEVVHKYNGNYCPHCGQEVNWE